MKNQRKVIAFLNKEKKSSKTRKTLFCLCFCIGTVSLCFSQNQHTWVVQQKPLNHVLDSIEKRLDVSFSYDYDLAKSIEVTKTIDFRSALLELCEDLFEDVPFVFDIDSQKNIRLIPQQKENHLAMKELQIIDSKTREPIPYVAISFDNGSGAETNEDGFFQVPGRRTNTILLHRLGYQQTEIDISKIENGNLIEMTPTPSPLQDILVVEEEPGIRLSDDSGGIEVKESQFKQSQGSVFTADPMRTIQLLPGISAHNDLSSEIRIRGGDADESLIILDGMTLYEAKHYYGIFSTINAGIVENISVYKNNTPADTEGRTSGVIDITTFPSEQKTNDFLDVQIGLMNASGSTVFSLGKTIQVMAGGRFTTGNPGQSRFQKLLNPRPSQRVQERDFESFNVVSQVPVYAFNDWNAKMQWDLSDHSKLFFTTFHSHDETQLDFERQLKVSGPNITVTLFEEIYDEKGAWNNHAYQLGSTVDLNEKTMWENRVVLSKSNSFSALSSLFSRRVNADSTRVGQYSNQIANDISDLHLFSTFTFQQMKSGRLKAGVDYQRIDNVFDIEYGDRKQFNQEQKAQMTSAFFAQKWRPNAKTTLDIGARLTHYDQTESFYFSPQISISHMIHQQSKVKFAYSSPAQMMQRAYYEDLTGRAYTFWINANDMQVPVSRAHKLMAGFQQIHNHFKWDIEGFYKHTKGIIELASNQIGFNPVTSGINANTKIRIFDGSSRSIGVDFLAIYDTKKYTGQVSYTLSKSEQQFSEIIDGAWIPSREDSRHQFKTSHTLKSKNWSFQALWIFSSGRPYTDISKIIGNPRDRNETDPSVFQSRLKDYHRFDLGVSYTLKQPSFDLYFGIGVLNVMNRRNVKYAQYIFGQKGAAGQTNTIAGTEWGLLDRTLNITAGARF
jgi:hypothetical protein